MPSFPVWLAIVGCVLAQGNLLAAWLTWSDQPFGRRLTRHWIIAATLYLIWVAGLALGQRNQFAEATSIVGLSVPLVSIAAQLPLWIARQAFGWRLIRGNPRNGARPAPLLIRHLMWATILVALALALARVAPIPADDERAGIWTVMALAAGVTSTIALLPPTPLLLRAQPFQRGILFAGLYAGFWIGLLWTVILVGRHYGLFAPPPLAAVVGASCLIFSFAGTVIFAAAIARARGYRLVWGRLPR
jgi:hypothetical protein